MQVLVGVEVFKRCTSNITDSVARPRGGRLKIKQEE